MLSHTALNFLEGGTTYIQRHIVLIFGGEVGVDERAGARNDRVKEKDAL